MRASRAMTSSASARASTTAGFTNDFPAGSTKLPAHALSAKPAFLFTTSGLSCLWKLWHAPFKKELAKKGFDVVGEFHCRGFDSWGPLWLTGGINRRHPDEQDLRRAAEFADRMQLAMRPQPAHKSLIEQPVSRAGE